MKVDATSTLCFSLLVACTGGQTGQADDTGGPEAGPCLQAPEAIAPEAYVAGVVPLEVALAVEGTYVSPIAWSTGGSPNDEATVRLAYEGGPARFDHCGFSAQIEMAVELSTRTSGIEERATGWMATYPIVSDPSYSPESGITLPSYMRATFGLSNTPVEAIMGAYDLPNGVVVSGSIIVDFEDNGFFPANLLECVPPKLNPSPESLVSFLNGLSPGDFAWPDIVPDRVTFRAGAAGCDEFGIARVPLLFEVALGDADPAEGSGELVIAHRAEDPEVAAILVTGHFIWDAEVLGVEPRSDGFACSRTGVNLALDAVRLPSDETPFEVVRASTDIMCTVGGT